MAAPTIPPPSPKPGKMRIAHVPNAGKLAQKPVIGASIGKQSATPGQKLPGQPGSLTYSQTAAKGVKREAHKSSSVCCNLDIYWFNHNQFQLYFLTFHNKLSERC